MKKLHLSTYVLATLFLGLGLIKLDTHVHGPARVFSGLVLAITHFYLLGVTHLRATKKDRQELIDYKNLKEMSAVESLLYAQSICDHEPEYKHIDSNCIKCGKLIYKGRDQ